MPLSNLKVDEAPNSKTPNLAINWFNLIESSQEDEDNDVLDDLDSMVISCY